MTLLTRSLAALIALTLPAQALARSEARTPPAPEAREVVPELFASGMPDLPPALTERLLQYQNTRSASLQDWSPRGGLLITTRFGDTEQAHRVASPLGARTQLTFEREPVRDILAATWAGRDGFFFSKDEGGSENYQVFFFDQASGRAERVTDGRSRHMSKRASPDGRWLAWVGTARNGRDFDVYVLDLATDAPPRLALEVQGMWEPIAWAPDGRELLVRHYVSINESTLHRLDPATGQTRPLVPAGKAKVAPKVAHGPAAYDGRGGVLFVTDAFGQFRELARVDLATGKVQRLTQRIPWDVEALDVSRAGDRLAFSVNEGGLSRLHLWQLSTLRPLPDPLPELPAGVLTGLRFAPDGHALAFGLSAAATPGDVFTLSADGRTLTRWTESEVGGLDPSAFVAPELVDFPTFDEVAGKPRRIPAFYYRPATGSGPFPVVVMIHGGPESQIRPWFSSVVQSWVRELGVAVVAPNVRGSSGYGKDYLLLDNGMKREDSVKDIGALLDWVKTRPELDAGRVAVYGGSYGGYMVLAAMARYPDRLRAGAEIVGISNFVTFLESTQEYRRDLRRAEYGDERDPKLRKFLEAISPTTLADRITKPLFVTQGLNDPRVPASESEQIVRVVRGRGAPVWYLLARDEGHGFSKKKNRDYYTGALALFWQRHLLDQATATGEAEGR